MQIYIVTAHKRYSENQKVLAAYDTSDGAEQLMRRIEDIETAWTISVVETELRRSLYSFENTMPTTDPWPPRPPIISAGTGVTPNIATTTADA